MTGLFLGLVLTACSDVPHQGELPLDRFAPPPAESDRLVPGVVGKVAVSADGTRKAWARRVDGALSTELVTAERSGVQWVEHVVLADFSPDRVAIHPAGDPVAYVSAESGYASVWVRPFDGGPPRQLTNVDLTPTKRSGPPDGWTPPPMDDNLRFEGDLVVWESLQGSHVARWR